MTLHGLHRLPKQWPKFARAAVLHAVSLASSAMTLTRARLLMEGGEATAREDELAALQDEVALLQEEIRIKDDRMARLVPCRRPHYPPMSRMAILELRARRGWSMGETARRFLIEPRTISSWMRRLDDGNERALVETVTPVNKFPEFVRYIVRRLKVLCPTMGKRKIAEVLARAGLHLGATTVRRMTLETGPVLPDDDEEVAIAAKTKIIARGPHHVWGVDLTVVPTQAGFWTCCLRSPGCSAGRSATGSQSSWTTSRAGRSASRSFARRPRLQMSRQFSTARLQASALHPATRSQTRASSSSARHSRPGAEATGSGRGSAPWESTAPSRWSSGSSVR